MERLAIDPPDGFVLGFFDPASSRTQHWSISQRGALGRITAGRTLATLPGAVLGCPAWFAADAAGDLAISAPSRRRP